MGHMVKFFMALAGSRAMNALPLVMEIHRVFIHRFHTRITTRRAIKILGRLKGFLYQNMP